MNQSGSIMSENTVKQYLFGELTETENERITEQAFLDDRLFFEIADTENDLIDRYTRHLLTGEELERFQKSLNIFPERRGKIANAAVLQTYISEGKAAAEAEAGAKTAAREVVSASSAPSFWERLSELFTLRTPALGYAMGGLLMIFALATVFLVIENRRREAEMARLENRQTEFGDWQNRETELQTQIDDSRRRESELQTQIDGERETSGDLTDDLETERNKRRALESDIEKLHRDAHVSPTPPTRPTEPTIAALVLPFGNLQGKIAPVSKQFKLEPAAKRVSIVLGLPAEIDKKERLNVQLNDAPAAKNLPVRISAGSASIQITVQSKDFKTGTNKLTVTGANGAKIAEYNLIVTKN